MALSEAQARASERLTNSYKATANREAAKIAAAVAIYYQTRVDPESLESVEAWLDLVVPRLIRASDSEAERARVYFDALRRIEVAGVNAEPYRAVAAKGAIDEGVRNSLLSVGPYDYVNKARKARELKTYTPAEEKAVISNIKEISTRNVAAAAVRHAQAGGRQTVFENSKQDRTALGWIRATRAKPCAFCAMLASRGIQYRPFREDSFEESDLRFTGAGNAKVHDECGCAMKAVYFKEDPILKRNEVFADMWTRWGAGGGNAAYRFRRGYDHWAKTGEFMSYEEAANAA